MSITREPVPTAASDLQWALQQVRRRQARWRAFRWLNLAVGAAAFTASLVLPRYLVKDFVDSFSTAPQVTHFEVYLATLHSATMTRCFLLGVLGAVQVAYTLLRWRGSPRDILLLKLYEDERRRHNSASL